MIIGWSGLGLGLAAAIVGFVLGQAPYGEISTAAAAGVAVAMFVLGIGFGYLIRHLRAVSGTDESDAWAAESCAQNIIVQLGILSREWPEPVSRSHAIAIERELECFGMGWVSPHLVATIDRWNEADESKEWPNQHWKSIINYTKALLRSGPPYAAPLEVVASCYGPCAVIRNSEPAEGAEHPTTST